MSNKDNLKQGIIYRKLRMVKHTIWNYMTSIFHRLYFIPPNSLVLLHHKKKDKTTTMNTATIHQVKTEIKHLDKNELIELCLKLAKFKKENKELLSYLLFEADDEANFIETIKNDITTEFNGINRSSSYLIKKSSRRILKEVKKYVRYSKKTETEIELLMHFCQELGQFKSALNQNIVLGNMYRTQVKVIQKCMSKIHEDLQYDYQDSFESLTNHKAY